MAAPASAHTTGKSVVVDLSDQKLYQIENGKVTKTMHVSTGKASTPTPVGRFTVQREIRGKRVAPLGVLYDPVYFRGGYAIHGSPSVPNYPASHGCVRIPMTDSRVFQDWATVGMPVTIRR
ncbi:MAG TPA: L,D-transpeptidase [Candidatus Saccharimonadales bacterium]|nr:L,D-transpeptidase [Candidatus Saccharimonadales bacterium]